MTNASQPRSDTTLQNDSETPLYRQLAAWMRSSIRSERFDPNAALPSERTLMSDFGVSRATVRQALGALEREGWVVRRHGLGTFVNPRKVEQPIGRLSGFSENMRRAGLAPSSRLLTARLESPEKETARLFGFAPSDAVVVERLRLADGVPLMLERSFLNARFVPGLLAHDLTGSLYSILTEHYGLELKTGEESLEVVTAGAELAQRLSIGAGDVVLYTERFVRTGEGEVLEFARRYARADKCRFRVTLAGGRADFAPKTSG